MSNDNRRVRYYVLAAVAVLVVGFFVYQLANVRGCTMAASRAGRDAGPGAVAAAGAAWQPTGSLSGPGERLLESLRLEGVVVDQDGKRVPEASVALNGPVRREATTSANGEFAFAGLNPNSYDVEAWAGDAAGGPLRVHLTRETKPVTIRVFTAGRLVVTVVDPQDKPLADADVALRVGGNQRNLTVLRSGKTGPDGRVVLRGVALSGYFVIAWAKGFQPKVDILNQPAGLEWEYKVVLEPGVSVSGRVVDESGAPVAGAHVNFTEPVKALPLVQPRIWPFTPTTDQRGAFTIPAVGAGQRQLKVRHDDFEMGLSDLFAVDGKTPVTGIVVKLTRGASLSGWVTLGGQPAPFAAVRASSGYGSGRTFLGETTCDASGRFKIGGLPRSAYVVMAAHDGVESEQVSVDLAQHDKTDLVLPLTVDGVVSGRVLTRGRAPIVAAVVFCNSFARSTVGLRQVLVETTDANGAFACRGLPPGDVMLVTEKPGSNNLVPSGLRGTNLRATVGQQGLELIIPDDGSMSGRVTLGNGAAAKEFRITLVKDIKPTVVRTGDGKFKLEALGAKDYKVMVAADGHKTRQLAASVKEGKDTDLGEIALEAGEDPPPRQNIPTLQHGQSLADLVKAATQPAPGRPAVPPPPDPPRPQPPPDPPPK